MINHAVTIA